MKLGKLEEVDLRKAWENEALNFTNWLAKEENLDMLGDELGISLQLIRTEANVGDFNVDILAEEKNTQKKVVIENQLESTDHSHLGQVITYASGFDAEIVVWIVKDVREEHRRAIDWLNEHSDEDVNFFAVRMELWQIEDSLFAPKFHIISQPNNWAKIIKKMSGVQAELSEIQLLKLKFWTKFKEYAEENNSELKLRKPPPQSFISISFGTSLAEIGLTADVKKNELHCYLWIHDSKELFQALEKRKKNIEQELDSPLEWSQILNKRTTKATAIVIRSSGDIHDTEKWNEYFTWMNETAIKFQKVFKKYIDEVKDEI